jgi:hypothetical protein
VLLKHGRRISVPFGWEHFSEGKLDPKCVFQRGLHVLAGEAAARRSGRRAWLVECRQWLTGLLGPIDGDPPRQLVLPARQFFPATDVTGHARALHYFDLVRGYMGLADRHYELVVPVIETGLGRFEGTSLAPYKAAAG